MNLISDNKVINHINDFNSILGVIEFSNEVKIIWSPPSKYLYISIKDIVPVNVKDEFLNFETSECNKVYSYLFRLLYRIVHLKILMLR